MATEIEVQAHILQKVEEDAEFRAQLIADPKAVIEAETGGELPDDMLVLVQEAIDTAQQEVSSIDTPLTEDELIQVMGGDCYTDPGMEWICPHVENIRGRL